MTINKIVSELKYIQEQHRQLNDFFFGDFVDAINKETPPQYAYLIATLQNSTDSNGFVGVNMILTVCDQYELGNTRMIQEIHSDCYQILNDIKITMLQERWVDFMDINIAVAKEPFINKGHDVTAGWSMSIQMNVFDEQNWCNIPYINYDFENGSFPPNPECLPVTISNENNTFVEVTDVDFVLPNTNLDIYVDGILQESTTFVTLDNSTEINIIL